ncbi:MAG: glycoside hydrolase family 92 protein [Candidatus Kapabacteria bacterium]|nr:glycoside hydrolase family 92 protein [Candidatus Kapabacteria bacterium]
MLIRLILSAMFLATVCAAQQLTRYVDPMTGTGGTGHTYPGATLPHGMMQLSPDTRRDGSWEGCAGYYHSDSLIYGFSHTHLSGTGCSDYGDILVMPFTGQMSNDPERCASHYRHDDEKAEPGYYAVTLTDNNIRAEFTTTLRAGMHRYHFPKSSAKGRKLLIDLRHRDKTLDAQLTLVSPTRIEGFRRSEAWAKDQHLYFAMEFSRPIVACTNATSAKPLPVGATLNGEAVAVAVTFTSGEDDVRARIGISSVDVQGARNNLQTEIPHWDFDRLRAAATSEWERELSRITVSGGTSTQLVNFYTSLYHTMVVPNVMSDVDGRYRGRDDSIHMASGHTQYTVFSLWDTFRAAHPLYTLIDSVRTLDYIKTFLNQYRQGGRLPVWELSANETDCMIGYHSVPVIADALVKGIGAFDTTLALEAMKASATWDHLGVPAYMARGYIGVEDEHESVSKTLEYAYDDWCIAEVARMLGRTDDMRTYYRRATSYRNIYDSVSGFMRPRRNGGWLAPFEPREVNNHYTEANSWQYSFFVPQDIPGLVRLMGGANAFERKLDELFSSPTETTGRDQADITGLIGQYAHGNEPSHHMAYLYNYVGKPWKTQRLVRQIMDSLYKPGPEGLPGNEDCGQMSAWYVWSAMGLYPVTPGSPYYAIGTPLFDTATISLGNRSVSIIADRESPRSVYVRELTIDGISHATNLITHSELAGARQIRFILSDQPAMERGTNLEQRGALADVSFVDAPTIASSNVFFTDSTVVHIVGDSVRYSLNGDSLHLPFRYAGPLTIRNTTRINARSYSDGDSSGVTTADFRHIPAGWKVVLNSTPNAPYRADGPVSLIDGVRGSTVWRKGDWLGFQGADMDVEIHLDTLTELSAISVGFLQDVRSWIVYPINIIVQTSPDGTTWTGGGTATHTIPVTDMASQTTSLTVNLTPIRTRHVRIRAATFGPLPSWHPGAGGMSYIFCDEIRLMTDD